MFNESILYVKNNMRMLVRSQIFVGGKLTLNKVETVVAYDMH